MSNLLHSQLTVGTQIDWCGLLGNAGKAHSQQAALFPLLIG